MANIKDARNTLASLTDDDAFLVDDGENKQISKANVKNTLGIDTLEAGEGTSGSVDYKIKNQAEAATFTPGTSGLTSILIGLAIKEIYAEKAQANGIATLDSAGQIPAAQLPTTAMSYKGSWDASSGTYPSSPDTGDYWLVSGAGTVSSEEYDVGDAIVYNGTSWDHINKVEIAEEVALTSSLFTAANVKAALEEIAGASRTTETVKGNADAIALNTTHRGGDGSDHSMVAANKLRTSQNTERINTTEKLLNQMNPSGDAEGTVSDYSIILLPKIAANGRLKFEFDGLIASQVIENGDFSNGTTNWIPLRAVNSAVSKGMITWNPEFDGNSSAYSQDIANLVSGDVYVVLLNQYLSRSTRFDIGLMDYGGYVNSQAVDVSTQPAGYTLRSVKFTCTKSSGRLFLADYNALASDTVGVGNVRLINLTSTFGSGNEPSEADCLKIYASYFSGTKSVPANGRVRSIGKNLLDMYKVVGLNSNLDIDSDTVVSKQGTQITGELDAAYEGVGQLNIPVYSQELAISYKTVSGGSHYYLEILDTNFNQIGNGNSITGWSPVSGGRYTVAVTSSKSLDLSGIPNAKYINISLVNTADTTAIVVDEWMINIGSSALDYEPYTHQDLYYKSNSDFLSVPAITDRLVQIDGVYKHEHNVATGALGSEEFSSLDFTVDWVEVGATVSDADTFVSSSGGQGIRLPSTFTIGKLYKIQIVTDNANCEFYNGVTLIGNTDGSILYFVAVSDIMYLRNSDASTTNATSISIKEIATTNGTPNATPSVIDDGTNGYYQLETPTYTIPEVSGSLLGHSLGSVIHDGAIPDAGVYGASGFSILDTNYPIDTIEEIIVYDFATGVPTYLDVSTAVFSSGDTSFTHPDASTDDIMSIKYHPTVKSGKGLLTATYLDSKNVVADTDNGKYYTWKPVITNGAIASWALTEV